MGQPLTDDIYLALVASRATDLKRAQDCHDGTAAGHARGLKALTTDKLKQELALRTRQKAAREMRA